MIKYILAVLVFVQVLNFVLPDKEVITLREEVEKFKFADRFQVYDNKVVPEYYKDNRRIVWIYDKEEVDAEFEAYEKRTSTKVKGLSSMNDEACVIHAYEPEFIGDDYMDTLGHEFYHCMRGKFHYQQSYD